VMLHECQPLYDILAPMLEADPQLFS
jgi:hypothetical protein